MYYALFHKKCFNNEAKFMTVLPQNVFGIFSTIRRNRKLTSFPVDIHGCIGYWDPNFKTLEKPILLNKLLQVSYDSVWNDDRRQYFPPIETEPSSSLELEFMLNPIYRIEATTGRILELNTMFNNRDFGIIIQTKDRKQKATYLPNVFPRISWKQLVISIKSKANITSDDFDVFAYKIVQFKQTFLALLTEKYLMYSIVSKYSNLLIKSMKPKFQFPFCYSCSNNRLEWNSNDDVRNIATLGQIFKLIHVFPEFASVNEINIIKQKVLAVLQNINRYSSQSLSFLGFATRILKINKEPFYRKLLHDLPSAEAEFEKPEIIIGLNEASYSFKLKESRFNESFKLYDAKINNSLKFNGLTFDSNDSIFKMNWTIQAIISAGKIPSKQLILILENKVDELLHSKQRVETNYLAVAFEALCFVAVRKGILMNKIFELFFELEKRKSCQDALYSFLDKTARVDITGHVINGFIRFHTM